MLMSLNESVVEDAALTWFKELDYVVAQAPHFAPGEIATERSPFADVLLASRLRDAIAHNQLGSTAECRITHHVR